MERGFVVESGWERGGDAVSLNNIGRDRQIL